MVVITFKEDDFFLSKINLKLESADQTVSHDVKVFFYSADDILIKPDKIIIPSKLKEELFSQGEEIKKLSKEIQLKSLTLAYESFFFYDIENMITEIFMTKLIKKISTFGLISFSGKTKIDNKLHLISPNNKLKFNLKKDIYKNRIRFELGKVHTKTSFSTTRDNVRNFGILFTNKNKIVGEKRTMSLEIVVTIHVLGLQNFVNYGQMNLNEVTLDSDESKTSILQKI